MIYYIKGSLWQKLYHIQPVEANSEEEAIEIFMKALQGKARDIDIEEVITDEARVMEIIGEVEDDDSSETVH